MSRFGEAIEADFAEHYPGEDPGQLWRQRRWRRLLNLIDWLPTRCRWRYLSVNDDDYAEAVVAAYPDQADNPPPDWLTWSPEAEGLARLADLVSQLVVDGAPRKRKYRAAKRPVTAIHAAYERSEARKDDVFEDEVFELFGVGSALAATDDQLAAFRVQDGYVPPDQTPAPGDDPPAAPA